MRTVSARTRGLQRGGTRWSTYKHLFQVDHRVRPRWGARWAVLWVHLGRRQQMPSGRPAGRGLVTRDHFSVR